MKRFNHDHCRGDAGEVEQLARVRLPSSIDEPMAREAVKAGGRIGVAVTFPPTIEPTTKLLRDTAARSHAGIVIVTEVMPDAYDALLAGDFQTHDARLLEGISHLVDQNVNAVVLDRSRWRESETLNGKFRCPS